MHGVHIKNKAAAVHIVNYLIACLFLWLKNMMSYAAYQLKPVVNFCFVNTFWQKRHKNMGKAGSSPRQGWPKPRKSPQLLVYHTATSI